MNQEPGMGMGLIIVVAAAIIVLRFIYAVAVLLIPRKPDALSPSIELIRLRAEIGQLHEEVEQLRDEISQRQTGPTGPGSTDIQSY